MLTLPRADQDNILGPTKITEFNVTCCPLWTSCALVSCTSYSCENVSWLRFYVYNVFT